MLKDTDKFENSSHFSYDDYKKKTHKSPNKDVMVFASVFIVALLIILGFAKILSPNVDVGITKESDVSVTDYDNDIQTSLIDERLRNLKMEDEGKKAGDEEMFSPDLDERVILPNRTRKSVGQIEAENSLLQQQKEERVLTEEAPENKTQTAQQSQPAPKPVAQPEQIVNARVVVGYYATDKQAEVAKSIIQDAGLGVTPIVKNLGGYYTLQVGSYSSKEKAQQAANNLLKSNFPARVIVE